MNINKLDTVSIKLIKGLISTSISFWKAQLKAINVDNDIADLYKGISPQLELADALEMDIDFIRSNIVAVLKGKLSEDDCAERIIKEYEEFYIDRIIEKEILFESMHEDLEYLNIINSKKELEAMIIFLTDDEWRVNIAYLDSIHCIEDLSQDGFKSKSAAMKYIEHLSQVHNIIKVVE
ncbi:hypothetical protein [Cytobacillus gottheilii]|uniref:hypothetical protein n=1 Tax=Cytobacillus gottheilii TaxID=859144 RepID=UPI002494889F|nr:hypothetical protein [Cytobacillus gottheilii]